MMKVLSLLLLSQVAMANPFTTPTSTSTLHENTATAQNSYNQQVAASNSMNQTALGAGVNQQQNAQQNTATANQQGADQAGKLGKSQTMLGSALIALGTAMKPPNVGLIAAGAMQLMQGKKSKQAQKAMNSTSNTATGLRDDLSSTPTGAVNTSPSTSGSGLINVSADDPSGSSIDVAGLGNSSLGNFLEGIQGTGTSIADLEKYADYDMDALKKAYPNVSDSQWDSAMKNAESAFADPNGSAANSLFGAAGKNGELAQAVLKDGTVGYGEANGEGGAGGANGANGNSLADLMKNFGAGKDANGLGGGFNLDGLPAVDGKDAKDKKADRQLASYSEKTIFQRVTNQYTKQGPALFSVDYFIRSKAKETPQELRGYIK